MISHQLHYVCGSHPDTSNLLLTCGVYDRRICKHNRDENPLPRCLVLAMFSSLPPFPTVRCAVLLTAIYLFGCAALGVSHVFGPLAVLMAVADGRNRTNRFTTTSLRSERELQRSQYDVHQCQLFPISNQQETFS